MAVTVTVPFAIAVTMPEVPTEAIVGSSTDHDTDLMEASWGDTVALSASVPLSVQMISDAPLIVMRVTEIRRLSGPAFYTGLHYPVMCRR